MCTQKYFKLVTKLHFQGDGNVGPLFIKNTSRIHEFSSNMSITLIH